MEFTKHIGSIHAYLEQLLKTATGGNVTVAYALHVARMQLSCRICGMTLTAPEPEGSSDLDYGVQEFIKLHAHAGGHGDKPSQYLVWKGGKSVPLTCDFKPTGVGMIDEKFKNVLRLQLFNEKNVLQRLEFGGTACCPLNAPKKASRLKIATGRKFK